MAFTFYMYHPIRLRCLLTFMDSQLLNSKTPLHIARNSSPYQHQFLPDMSLIHEKFVDLWFKHINYFESHSGQLPAENLRFIDGLNFIECCFLQNEMDIMADVVAEYAELDSNKSQDFYTVEFDMNAQVSAYMNYIDHRLTALNQIQTLLHQHLHLTAISFGETGKG